MKDRDKTKKQLVNELGELRQRITELEAANTERERVEEALRTEKEFTDTALDTQLDTFFLFEPATGKALRWNRAFRDISGYTDEEIARMPAPASYYSPEDLEQAGAFIQKVLEEGTGTIELELIGKDSRKAPTEYRVSVISDDQGEPKYIISIGRDITERRQAEQQLRTLSSVVEQSANSIAIIDREGNVEHANPTFLQLNEFDPDEVIGKNWRSSVSPHSTLREKFPEIQEAVLGRGTVWRGEVTDRARDGKVIWREATLFPIMDAEGEITHTVYTSTDITARKQAEEEIGRLAKFPSENPNPVLRIARDGVVLYANPASQPLLNAWGCQVGRLLPDDWREFALDTFSSGSHKETEIEYEDRIFSLTFAPVVDADYGNVYGLDVTERKQAEEALRESEAHFRILAEGSIQGILVHQNTKPLFVNRAYANILGYESPDEILNMESVVPLIAPYEQERLLSYHQVRLKGAYAPNHYEYDALCKDGSIVTLHNIVTMVNWTNEPAVLATVIDVTERKQAEEEIERLAKFPSENPNPVLRIARDGIILYANQASQPLVNAWGCQVGQLLPDDWHEFALDAFGSGSHKETEIEYEDRIFSLTFAPVVGADYGNVYGLDVTERKGAEEALKESEGLLRTIAANYPAYLSIIERGEEGMTIGFTSGKEFTRLDLDPDAFVGLTLEDVFGEQAPIVRQHYLDAFGGEEVSFELFLNDQYQFYSVVPLYDGDEVTALLAVVEDITERVQAEEALRELNVTLEARVRERTAELQAQYAQLDAILSSTTDGIVVTDREGNITQANPVAQTWLAETLSPRDAERLHEAVRDLAQRADERPVMALELTEQDLEVSAAPVVEEGAEEPLAAVVDIHDISPFKALDRMKTMFITNIAHELRTPVSTVKSYAYLMQRTPPEDEKWGQHLDALVQETDQQVRLVEDVVQVSRIYTGRLDIEPRPTPLTELTEVVGTSHRALAQERGVTLAHCPMEPAPVALIDPRQMLPALDHLVRDAIRYTPEGGRVAISTERRDAEGSVWATVAVSDTGDVIPAEDLPHIFERFFREEEPRSVRVSETGLRLMIVKGIVELHGGRVTVESEEGVGSTFTVWLPLASH